MTGASTRLARCSKKRSFVQSLYSRLSVLTEEVESNPQDVETWLDLGNSLQQGQKTLVENTEVDACDCYIKVLQLKSDESEAWNNLGASLADDEKRAIHQGGEKYGQRECFTYALMYDCENAESWQNLSVILKPGEHVTLMGQRLDANGCLILAQQMKGDSLTNESSDEVIANYHGQEKEIPQETGKEFTGTRTSNNAGRGELGTDISWRDMLQSLRSGHDPYHSSISKEKNCFNSDTESSTGPSPIRVLQRTDFTDTDVAEESPIRNLISVNLSETDITDASPIRALLQVNPSETDMTDSSPIRNFISVNLSETDAAEENPIHVPPPAVLIDSDSFDASTLHYFQTPVTTDTDIAEQDPTCSIVPLEPKSETEPKALHSTPASPEALKFHAISPLPRSSKPTRDLNKCTNRRYTIPTKVESWFELGCNLAENDALSNGRSALVCYLISAAHEDAGCSETWNNIASELEDDERITFNGNMFDRISCIKHAIELDPINAIAEHNLVCLEKSDIFHLPSDFMHIVTSLTWLDKSILWEQEYSL